MTIAEREIGKQQGQEKTNIAEQVSEEANTRAQVLEHVTNTYDKKNAKMTKTQYNTEYYRNY